MSAIAIAPAQNYIDDIRTEPQAHSHLLVEMFVAYYQYAEGEQADKRQDKAFYFLNIYNLVEALRQEAETK